MTHYYNKYKSCIHETKWYGVRKNITAPRRPIKDGISERRGRGANCTVTSRNDGRVVVVRGWSARWWVWLFSGVNSGHGHRLVLVAATTMTIGGRGEEPRQDACQGCHPGNELDVRCSPIASSRSRRPVRDILPEPFLTATDTWGVPLSWERASIPARGERGSAFNRRITCSSWARSLYFREPSRMCVYSWYYCILCVRLRAEIVMCGG